MWVLCAFFETAVTIRKTTPCLYHTKHTENQPPNHKKPPIFPTPPIKPIRPNHPIPCPVCEETVSDRFNSAAENKKTTAINKPPCPGHQLDRKALLRKPEVYVEEKSARGPRHEDGNGGGRRI